MIQKNFFFQIGHLGVLLLLLRGVTPNWMCRWNRAQFTINIYKVMTSNPQALGVWTPFVQVDPLFPGWDYAEILNFKREYVLHDSITDTWRLNPVDPPFFTKLNFTKFILFPLRYVYSTYLCLKCCVSSLCLPCSVPAHKDLNYSVVLYFDLELLMKVIPETRHVY
jgi:hypothetical protein